LPGQKLHRCDGRSGLGLARGRLSIAVAFTLVGSSLLVGSAHGAPNSWSLVQEATWTDAKVFRYRFVKAPGMGIPRPAHFLGVWIPRDKPPAGRARATITRAFEKLEGDTVTLTFFGEPVERSVHPHAAVAVYVLCHILAPGQAEPGVPPEWVKIGQATVKPTFALQKVTAK
jgi:hypothetical protein